MGTTVEVTKDVTYIHFTRLTRESFERLRPIMDTVKDVNRDTYTYSTGSLDLAEGDGQRIHIIFLCNIEGSDQPLLPFPVDEKGDFVS